MGTEIRQGLTEGELRELLGEAADYIDFLRRTIIHIADDDLDDGKRTARQLADGWASDRHDE